MAGKDVIDRLLVLRNHNRNVIELLDDAATLEVQGGGPGRSLQPERLPDRGPADAVPARTAA